MPSVQQITNPNNNKRISEVRKNVHKLSIPILMGTFHYKTVNEAN